MRDCSCSYCTWYRKKDYFIKHGRRPLAVINDDYYTKSEVSAIKQLSCEQIEEFMEFYATTEERSFFMN